MHITAPRLPPVALHSEKKRPGQGLGSPLCPAPVLPVGATATATATVQQQWAGAAALGSAGHWLQWWAGSLSGIQVATGSHGSSSSSSGRSLGKVVASLFLHSCQIGP